MESIDFKFNYEGANRKGYVQGTISWTGEMKLKEDELTELAENQCINQYSKLLAELNGNGNVSTWRSGRYTFEAKIVTSDEESLNNIQSKKKPKK